MARTRWPPGPCEPRPLAQARQIRPAAPVGAKDWGPADRSLSTQPESGVGRFGGQAGTRSPTLRPHHHETAEAGPEHSSTSSLPIPCQRPGRCHHRAASPAPPLAHLGPGQKDRRTRPVQRGDRRAGPRQRGSNQNTGGRLRKYFPRSTDFRALTQSDLDNVAAELNDRPGKHPDGSHHVRHCMRRCDDRLRPRG
jgi:hypothetical protein